MVCPVWDGVFLIRMEPKSQRFTKENHQFTKETHPFTKENHQFKQENHPFTKEKSSIYTGKSSSKPPHTMFHVTFSAVLHVWLAVTSGARSRNKLNPRRPIYGGEL